MSTVKHYSDYRSFILAHVQDKKRSHRNWNLSKWAAELQLKSTSSISKVVSGARLPGPKLMDKLVKYFEFNTDEADYFCNLVRFHKVKSDPRLASVILEKLGKDHPDGSLRILDNDTFMIISNWYSLAMRELARTNYFFSDPDWISRIFEFELSYKEIKSGIRHLENLNLIYRNIHGNFEVTNDRVLTRNDLSQEAIKRYHEGSMGLAKQAVRKYTVNEREFQSSVLVIKEENIKVAKKLIREFRAKFVKLLEETSGDRIYQIQLQFFPLTKNLKTTKMNSMQKNRTSVSC